MLGDENSSEASNHANTALQLLEAEQHKELSEFLDNLHPVELVSTVSSVSSDLRIQLIRHVTGLDQVAALVSHANERVREQTLELLDDSRIAAVVRRLEVDDAADVVASLPRRKQVSVLRKVSAKRAKEITTLLSYDQETAGGIMTTRFVHLPRDLSVEAGFLQIRTQLAAGEIDESTDINYVYLLDDSGRLEGVCSLRELLTAAPTARLSDLAAPEPITVGPDDDQERVARLIANYDLTALPVVAPLTNEMLGIVTVDDILDVMEEEHNEDVLRLAGTEDADIVGATVKVSLRSRLPWLAASWLGGVFGAMLLGGFSGTLERLVALAFFMPIVFGMGGNVGSQSSTITVRGIATGELGRHRIRSRLRKEALVGLALGTVFGSLLALAAYILYGEPSLSLIVGISTLITMTCAAAFGSMAPLLFARLGFDPAVASGPFVTTATDILSISIYFTIATLLL